MNINLQTFKQVFMMNLLHLKKGILFLLCISGSFLSYGQTTVTQSSSLDLENSLACGVPEITDVTDFGFGTYALVLEVSGGEPANECINITCPENVVTDIDLDLCTAKVVMEATATDACTVNAVATDANGNSANCSYTITVNENIPPTPICPAIPDVNLEGMGTATLQPNIGTGLSSDNCSTPTETSPSVNVDCSMFGIPQMVTLTATDASGTAVSTDCTFNVVDPNGTCGATPTCIALAGALTAPSSACAPATVSVSALGFQGNTNIYTQTYVLADASGNILDIQSSGVFSGVGGGSYIVASFNYLTADGAPSTSDNLNTYSKGTGCFDIESQSFLVGDPQPAFASTPSQVCENGFATFSLTASYSSYSWSASGASITGGGGNGDDFAEVTFGNQPSTVSVMVTDAFGCTASTSQAVTIGSVPILASASASVCSGQPTGMSLSTALGSPAAVSYELVSVSLDPDLSADGGNQGPATGLTANALASDVYTNTSSGPLTATYALRATTGDNCTSDIQNVTATILPAPSITGGLNYTTCSGQPANLLLSTTNALPGTIFSWSPQSLPAGISLVSNSSPGTVISDILINNTASPIDVIYDVIAVSGNCASVIEPCTISVVPFPLVLPTASLSICEDNNTPGQGSFNLSSLDASIGSGLPVNYFTDPNLLNSISTPDAFVSGPTTVYAAVVSANNICPNRTDITLTINNLALPQVNSSLFLCSNTSQEIIPAPVIGNIFNFYDNDPDLGGLLLGSGPSYDPMLAAGQSQTIWITATDGSCESPAVAVNVNVNPVPFIQATSNSPVCGEGLDLNLSAAGQAIIYQWTGPNNFSFQGANVTIPNASSANSGSYQLTGIDGEGCTNTVYTQVQIEEEPQIAVTPNLTATCFEEINPNPASAEVTTTCDLGFNVTVAGPEVTLPYEGADPNCTGAEYKYTFIVTDACSCLLTAEAIQTYTIENDGPMNMVCPPDMTVTCEDDIMTDTDAVTADIDCDLDSEVTVSEPVIDGQPGCDGTTYTFTYTITDGCLRTATCEQVFTLDNAAPDVTIPTNETVTCAADIEVSTDDMTVVQDCPGELTLSVNGPVIDGPENCPGTTYTYTYRAIDDCGRVVNENRVFTIGANEEPTITAPVDFNVTCLGGSNPNPAWATYTTSCDNGVEAEVTVSGPQISGPLDCPGTTYTYTYTVTDACGRSAFDTQTLTVANDGPELTCPAPLQVFGCLEGNFNDKIEAWIETVDASSSCGVDLTVTNNFNGNAGICLGNNFTTVTFSATDACGRSASCEGTIAITDTDAPIIYTEPQEMLVPCTGNTQQIFNDWLATQGGAQATDGCWGDQISWSASVGPNALNCSNGPQAIVVTFTASDGCGNTATTIGIFNTKLLPNQINVSGLIQREDAEPVANVQIGAYLGGGLPQMDMSDNAGDYAFPELAFDENTEIVPEKNDDPLNGLSTFDLVLLQQHVLGINELNSPYKRIAADINRSGNISTLDLVLLRRLILHIDEEFTDNTSWRFVDADYVFPNPQNPFANEFPEIYNVAGQEEEVADFVAVKIGDLNLDGDTYGFVNTEVDDRELNELNFAIEDQELIAGEEYRIDVNAQNFERITGFQFTLNFESGIEVLDIEAGDLVNFNEQNFNLAKRENGAIPMSWNADRGQDLSSADVAFSVIITANANVRLSEVLSITSQYTKAEAYQATELLNVNLTFNDNGQMVRATEFKLFQNTPNPFKDATTVGFQLPEAGEVSLEIYDVSGRLLFSEMGTFVAGYNQFELNRSDLPGGILYYQVNTANASDSKKMILIE